MADFKSREQSFEAKAARDQETEFKIAARRNKLLGQWAAGEMGLTGPDADAYAKTVVAADLDEPGEEDVYRKVAGDLKAKGVEVSEHRIRKHMAELLEEARRQITS
jgi:hypothetical protein